MELLIALVFIIVICYGLSNAVRARLIKANNRYYDLFAILTFISCFVLIAVGLYIFLIYSFDR